MRGHKLVAITTSSFLKRTSTACSSTVMIKSQQLRHGSGGGGQVQTGGGAFEEGETRPWNYLWQPAPYPQTKEEREAAARKYVSSSIFSACSCPNRLISLCPITNFSRIGYDSWRLWAVRSNRLGHGRLSQVRKVLTRFEIRTNRLGLYGR